MIRTHEIFRLAGLAALLLCLPSLVQAQAPPWPNKPIRMVAPFSPGGAVDVLAWHCPAL